MTSRDWAPGDGTWAVFQFDTDETLVEEAKRRFAADCL